jgi:DNA primase
MGNSLIGGKMAKISPVSIKYVIHAKFQADGALEKPDVIGAIFGQTEGLLGSELEMRELQKEGKIGRIDVDVEYKDGKTTGMIRIPSALDKAETTILAASIETIERIGTNNSKIEIDSIEDVRANKRDYIIERAKSLLEKVEGSVPESREIENAVKTSVKLSKLHEYGEEKLPAGDISGEEIIVVEGRADVVNLLKNSVKNVIAMNGTILPETIKELSYDKEITLFVDGDRGGQLIVKNVADNARVDYVVVAPDGKEVEELSGKEVLSCLRKKIPIQEFLRLANGKNNYRNRENRRDNRNSGQDRRSYQREEKKVEEAREITEADKERISKMVEEIRGKKQVLILNSDLEILKKTSINNLRNSLKRIQENPYCVVLDGKATASAIHAVEDAGAGYLVAQNFVFQDSKVKLISL